MSEEASNILRRYIRAVEHLDPSQLGYLRKSARTLHPFDLRLLAREMLDVGVPQRLIRYTAPGQPPISSVEELRGLARSIIRYGGPDAVRRDAEPDLIEAVNRIGWPS